MKGVVDLYRPKGDAIGAVALVHGGFWRAMYGREGLEPHCRDLADRGYLAGNIGYRRVGERGGGFPNTCTDVVRALSGMGRLTAIVGHSAGGQLALWAAKELDPRPRLVVTVSGCNDLAHADDMNLGNGAVRDFTGGSADARRRADPMQRLPLGVRTVVVVPDGDPSNQKELSTNYVAAAHAADDDVELVEVKGDHLSLLDIQSDVWAAVLAAITAA